MPLRGGSPRGCCASLVLLELMAGAQGMCLRVCGGGEAGCAWPVGWAGVRASVMPSVCSHRLRPHPQASTASLCSQQVKSLWKKSTSKLSYSLARFQCIKRVGISASGS